MRTMPHDLATERALLGAMLRRAEVIDESGDLRGEWYSREHERLYRLLRDIHAEGEPIDVATVGARIGDRGDLYGGHSYVQGLTLQCPSVLAAQAYVGIVRDRAARRRLLTELERHMDSVVACEPGSMEAMLRAMEEASRVVGTRSEALSLRGQVAPVVRASIERAGRLPGAPTGLGAWDGIVPGFERGRLYVIGARPAVGKSALGLTMAYRMARGARPVAIASLEMPRSEVIERLLSMVTGVYYSRIRRGDLDRGHHVELARAEEALEALPMGIDDRPRLSVDEVAAHARAVQREHGDLELLLVDHLHITAEAKQEDTVRGIGLATSGYKALAKRLDCAVLLLTQLNRQAEGQRPRIEHARGSGSIEEDADVMVMLERPGARDEHAEDQRLHCHVDKQRGGRTGTVHLQWIGPRVTVAEEGDEGNDYDYDRGPY